MLGDDTKSSFVGLFLSLVCLSRKERSGLSGLRMGFCSGLGSLSEGVLDRRESSLGYFCILPLSDNNSFIIKGRSGLETSIIIWVSLIRCNGQKKAEYHQR